MIGGSTSVIAGGKFGNGAITGAFSMAFNQLQHHETNEMDGEFYANGTDVDFNGFSDRIDPDLYSYASNFPDKKGYFYAAFHSLAESSEYEYVAGSHLYKNGTPATLWNKIRSSPRYSSGDTIVLLSCSSRSSGLAHGLIDAAKADGFSIKVVSSASPIVWRRTTQVTTRGTTISTRMFHTFFEGTLNSDYSVSNTGRRAKWEKFQ